jgi:hypothetical protein
VRSSLPVGLENVVQNQVACLLFNVGGLIAYVSHPKTTVNDNTVSPSVMSVSQSASQSVVQRHAQAKKKKRENINPFRLQHVRQDFHTNGNLKGGHRQKKKDR